MMNTVVGSAIGGLVAGAVAIGAAAAMKPSPAPVSAPDPNSAYAMTVANTGAMNNGASLGNAGTPGMQCQPYEEAVLRRAFVAGREMTDVACITRSSSFAPQAAYAQPVYTQAGYAQPVYNDNIVRRPVTQARTVSRSSTSAARRETSDRSWGKTAMIIGGSAGGGAGLGGLIGGKKGALIGAAIGGGAATIYEARKR
jgi:hypothetical protein